MASPDMGSADIKSRAAGGQPLSASAAQKGKPPAIAPVVWSIIQKYFDEKDWEKMAGVSRSFRDLEAIQWKQFAARRNMVGVKDRIEFMERLHAINEKALSLFPDSSIAHGLRKVKNPIQQNLLMEEIAKSGTGLFSREPALKEGGHIIQEGEDVVAILKSMYRPEVFNLSMNINKATEDDILAIKLAIKMGFCKTLNNLEFMQLMIAAIVGKKLPILQAVLETYTKDPNQLMELIFLFYVPHRPEATPDKELKIPVMKMIMERFPDLSKEAIIAAAASQQRANIDPKLLADDLAIVERQIQQEKEKSGKQSVEEID